MKRSVFLAALFFAQAVAAATVVPVTIETAKKPVVLKLEVAATELSREKGLMYRKTLKPNDGMLFLFPQSNRISFWMKNTPLPLDILFVASNGKIIHIAENTTPYSLTPIASDGVYISTIELNAGRAKREGIAEGDHVTYQLPKEVHVQ